MRRLLVTALFAITAALAPPARSGGLRLRLAADVAVSGDLVFLSHLLPAAAPAALRMAAARVPLGAAPAAGSVRVLSRSEIFLAFQSAGVSQARQPLIPETITLRRAGVFLTVASLVPLLTDTLGVSLPLSDSDISLPASLLLPEPVPAFRVLGIKPDPILNATTVRLAPQAGNAVVPFDVIVRARTAASPPLPSPISSSAPRASASLVDPRRMARLSISSAQSRMWLQVRPLERGDFGQTIRVRLPASGKTFRARVIALDLLEAHF